MTQIAQALIKAGVPLKPLTERLWLYIKDHPGITAIAMGKIYGDNAKHLLYQMCKRGMLTKGEVFQRAADGKMRKAVTYKTSKSEYEMVPYPLRAKKPVKPMQSTKPVLIPQQETATLEPDTQEADIQEQMIDAFVSALTVAEALGLLAKLQTIFGKK